MKDTIWNLFKKTGDIKYYLLLTNMGRSDYYDRRSGRNNTK